METTNEIINFMGGKSFKMFNPLTRAKLVAFSSFLGENLHIINLLKEMKHI